MTTSESIKNISDALLKFDSEVAKIGKTATNPFFHNKYAPLPDILAAIKDPLQNANLVVKQFPEGEYELTTLIMHPPSGEWISSTYKMEPAKKDPQSEGSRITYQRRYALGACLGLNIDEDDDGDKASNPGEQQQSQPEDARPWLSDKQLESAITRIRNLDTNGLTPADFVKKIYAEFKVNKKHRAAFDEELKA